jgi:hypothetical protein
MVKPNLGDPYEDLADIVAIQMKASSMKPAMVKHSRVLEGNRRKSMLNSTYYRKVSLYTTGRKVRKFTFLSLP